MNRLTEISVMNSLGRKMVFYWVNVITCFQIKMMDSMLIIRRVYEKVKGDKKASIYIRCKLKE